MKSAWYVWILVGVIIAAVAYIFIFIWPIGLDSKLKIKSRLAERYADSSYFYKLGYDKGYDKGLNKGWKKGYDEGVSDQKEIDNDSLSRCNDSISRCHDSIVSLDSLLNDCRSHKAKKGAKPAPAKIQKKAPKAETPGSYSSGR